MSIQMKPFTEQALLMARFSKLAYLPEHEGKEAFGKLGYDAVLLDVNGSQAYVLSDNVDLVLVCRGTEATQWADIKADLRSEEHTSELQSH